MILIAYDGSADATAAIEHAAALMPGQPALVLTVWDPYVNVIARYPGAGAVFVPGDAGEVDDASRAAAEDTSEAGAGLARTHGLDAGSRASAREDSIAQTVLAVADRCDASAIVVGSRGLGGLGSLLLGSVSHGLVQHADRPVVIVPSPTVARQRNAKLRAAEGASA